MIFLDGTGGLRVELEDAVIERLLDFRQMSWRQHERGGQLFGEIVGSHVVVSDITGPRSADRSGLNWYEIDQAAAQAEIDERYTRGLNFVGDWHSHAQRNPGPSDRDFRSMRSLFATSRHGLNAIVMLIIGTETNPATWWCSAHGRFDFVHFAPERVISQ